MLLALLLALNAAAGTLYVDLHSTNPVSPYSDWSTAATNIQDAVDAAGTGDLVLVNDGVYQTGGRVVYGALTNRLAVTNAVTVQSVNGAAATIINGYQVPGTTNGDSAVRCVYLTNGAALIGFTLTNGATRMYGDGVGERSGGGILCATNSAVLVSNCCLAGNAANVFGGGAYGGLLTGCTFSGNAANSGGGAAYATVQNGVFLSNAATAGGGVYRCTLSDCTLATNSVHFSSGSAVGGGAMYSTVSRCTLIGNTGSKGAGSYYGALYNCTLVGNSASDSGGGSYGSSLSNCSLEGNSAAWAGGGACGCSAVSNCVFRGNSSLQGGGAALSTLYGCLLTRNLAIGSPGVGGGAISCTLHNCTVARNSANLSTGGAYTCTLNNCIIYYNIGGGADPNYAGGTLNYCCTLPQPLAGVGNIQTEPRFASASHISAVSPCVGAGGAAYASGTDIDGEAWGAPPSIGCDEVWTGSATGAVSVAIEIAFTDFAVGSAMALDGNIEGRVTASRWDFGDGTSLSNQPYASHAWLAPGDYAVVLSAYNDTYPGGISSTAVVHVLAQSVYYVDLNSPGPVIPYSSWATAATNLQDAVDAAPPGALVLVTNGTYGSGGHAVFGALTNRLAVTRPLTVQSVNGPGMTVIQGYRVPGTTNGDGATRCAYLTNGAALVGFTLTGGATRASGDSSSERSGGGVYCESPLAVVSNCVLTANAASSGGGGAFGGGLYGCLLSNNWSSSNGGGACFSWMSNCTLTVNSGALGGGAYSGNLTDCSLIRNSGALGGGANGASLRRCTLMGNSANNGGGSYSGTLMNCVLTNNMAITNGGGAYSGTLVNSTLIGNTADAGGGACSSTLTGCALVGNSALNTGGGATSANLTNCTVTGNSAAAVGGGLNYCTSANCLVYYNRAATYPNWSQGSFNYCLTTPLPAGTGNIDAEPQLASTWHLSIGSPCRSAGNTACATGADLDGESWANPPAIGCDELYPGASVGELGITIQACYTNVATGFLVDLLCQTKGPTTSSWWEFDDGTVLSNCPYTSHAWSVPGDHLVTLRAYNNSNPVGSAATLVVRVVTPPVHYVSVTSGTPLAPYTSWSTAARSIQDAVDATVVPGALVLVTNGIYTSGGRVVYGAMSNRVAVTRPVLVQSVNGPGSTVIQGFQVPGTTNGDGAVRCAYLTNGGALVGFTLRLGATRKSGDSVLENCGGGVWCASSASILSNCLLVANAAGNVGGGAFSGTLHTCTLAFNSAINYGGGAYLSMLNRCLLATNSTQMWSGGADSGILNQCLLVGNSAWYAGGGAHAATLNNCTLVANWAYSLGGGADYSTLNNCILYYNRAPSNTNANGSALSYCCTTPLPAGPGNFTNAPLLVDVAGGNYRLQANSPCVNAGLNAYVTNCTDLDGNSRISGGTVDVGAYEFQNPASTISYAWLQQYGLPADGTADTADSDLDGMNSWQEWRAGTDPTNAMSVLQMLAPTNGAVGVTVTWQSVTNRSYYLQRSLNLSAQPPFVNVQSNIVGQAGTTSYTDTNGVGAGPFFYCVGVQ
jgi:hypothetical protein